MKTAVLICDAFILIENLISYIKRTGIFWDETRLKYKSHKPYDTNQIIVIPLALVPRNYFSKSKCERKLTL
jgi:hypothetical protein